MRFATVKRRVAATLGLALFWSGAYRWLLRRRAAVVMFHRVDDRLAGDCITCTTGEFDAYLRFFRRYFTVVSLGELLDRLASGQAVGRHLAITFDDGYRDNHATAAVVLRRHGLPAAFFIATEFIGSRRVPWWDAERGIASEWMTWDQVRSLHGQGFQIGAHTRNHVDLGVVAGKEANEEIVGSKQRLEREIGAEVPYFAFPYGRPENFTEANRALVRGAGFRACLSGMGGCVERGADPFALPRFAVSPWYLSPYQLGFDVALNRT